MKIEYVVSQWQSGAITSEEAMTKIADLTKPKQPKAKTPKVKTPIDGYLTGCKKLSDVKRQIITARTKGIYFYYSGTPNGDVEIERRKQEAEEYATQLIKENIEHIPVKIKRDIEI